LSGATESTAPSKAVARNTAGILNQSEDAFTIVSSIYFVALTSPDISNSTLAMNFTFNRKSLASLIPHSRSHLESARADRRVVS
jgi:hypothetical protein